MSSPSEHPTDLDMTDLPDSPPQNESELPALDTSSSSTTNDPASKMSPTMRSAQAPATGEQNAAGATSLVQGLPGASWNNKKAKEEYERASEQLLDRNWTMAQYGDPLAKK